MNDETVTGVIPNLKHKVGFLKYEICDVVISSKRLVIAHITKEEQQARSDSLVLDKYQARPVEEILSESSKNFSLDQSQLKNLRVEQGAGGDVDTSGGPDRLLIKASSGKHVFIFGKKSIPAKEAKALLQEKFGNL